MDIKKIHLKSDKLSLYFLLGCIVSTLILILALFLIDHFNIGSKSAPRDGVEANMLVTFFTLSSVSIFLLIVSICLGLWSLSHRKKALFWVIPELIVLIIVGFEIITQFYPIGR